MGVHMYQSRPNQTKPKLPSYVGDNILESVRGIGTNVAKSAQEDVAAKIPKDALDSLLNIQTADTELHPDERIQVNATKTEHVQEKPKNALQPIADTVAKKTEQDLQIVRQQLRTLAASPSTPIEIKRSVLQEPAQQGVYHLDFFDRIKNTLQNIARTNTDNGLSWFENTGKRKAKRGYWGQYKKHGTSFGLSNERTAATQTG